MDVLQQVVDQYNLGEFFHNDIVDISTRVIEGEITKPTSLSDFEVLEQICKNLPPSSSAGVSSTSTERLNMPQLVQYSDSDTDDESDTDDDESVSQQNNAKSIAFVEISSSENEGASADKMGLIQLENISNNTSEDERKHDVVEEQSRKKKLTKKRSTPKRSKLVY